MLHNTNKGLLVIVMAENIEKRLDSFQHKNELEHRNMENSISEVKTSVANLDEKVDERFERVDERFERVDERFERVDERIEKVEGKLGKIEKKVDELGTRIEVLLAHMFWIRTIIALAMATVSLSFLGGVIKWIFFNN